MKNAANKPPRRATLKDIAQATGFSVNTVSHALKNQSDISQKTKDMICSTAREMGYIADSIAGSLRSGVTRTIAVILGDIFNPHFGLWVREIQTAVFAQGYSTLVINTDEDENVEYDALVTAIGKRVDGIILCPTQKKEENLELLRRCGIPYVLIGRRPPEDTLSDWVIYDDVEGGFMATWDLLARGHRRILFLNGPGHISSARERLEGYLAAHRDAQVPIDLSLVREVGIKSGGCLEALSQLIDSRMQFTAIVAFSDILALEAMEALRKAGGIYEKIPVTGFDDILQGIHLPIPLTSVGSAQGSAAERAVSILLTRMEEKMEGRQPQAPMQAVLMVKLFQRN